MICDRCKRRSVMPGKRHCPHCYHVLRAEFLEARASHYESRARLLEDRLERQALRLVELKAGLPESVLEFEDARIVRCARCDARRLPDSPHECKRKAVAA